MSYLDLQYDMQEAIFKKMSINELKIQRTLNRQSKNLADAEINRRHQQYFGFIDKPIGYKIKDLELHKLDLVLNTPLIPSKILASNYYTFHPLEFLTPDGLNEQFPEEFFRMTSRANLLRHDSDDNPIILDPIIVVRDKLLTEGYEKYHNHVIRAYHRFIWINRDVTSYYSVADHYEHMTGHLNRDLTAPLLSLARRFDDKFNEEIYESVSFEPDFVPELALELYKIYRDNKIKDPSMTFKHAIHSDVLEMIRKIPNSFISIDKVDYFIEVRPFKYNFAEDDDTFIRELNMEIYHKAREMKQDILTEISNIQSRITEDNVRTLNTYLNRKIENLKKTVPDGHNFNFIV